MSGRNQPKILLVGATGLVGSAVTAEMAAQRRDLSVLVRHWRGSADDTPLVFEAGVETWPDIIFRTGPDVVISTLGTTWRNAGSEAAFRAIDQNLVLGVAKAAKAAGAWQMIAVSAIGANADSRNFYLRVKGEVEDSLAALNFERLDIMRPGLLVGERGGESRVMEHLAIMASPLTDAMLHGRFRRYRSIDARIVACAITTLAGADASGVFIHQFDDIMALAR